MLDISAYYNSHHRERYRYGICSFFAYPLLQPTPLCEGHLFTHLILAADDITTHAPLRGHQEQFLKAISTCNYNSRPSARGIIAPMRPFASLV